MKRIFENDNEYYPNYISIDSILEDNLKIIEYRYEKERNEKVYISEHKKIHTFLDDLFFLKGDFVVLAGKPKKGKTTFSLNLALHLATINKTPVGYISCGENDSFTLGRKLLSIHSGFPLSKIRTSFFKKDEFNVLRKSINELSEKKLFFNDFPNIKYDDFELVAKEMVSQGVKVIFIDSYEYLFEITNESVSSMKEHYIKKYKALARQLNITIILNVSLSDSSKNKEPEISDFKNNMYLSRLADMILFIQIEDKYIDNDYIFSKLIIAKNYLGPAETPVYLMLNSRTFKIEKLPGL